MRFGVPRSSSPSPERKSTTQSISTNRFRAPVTYDTDSDSSDYDEFASQQGDTSYDLDISVDVDEAGKSEDKDEDSNLLVPWNKLSLNGHTAEERAVSEVVSSVRSHARHVDPYEEWESQMRKDAFLTARRQHSSVLHQMREEQRKAHVAKQQEFDMLRTREIEFLRTSMDKYRKNTLIAENQLRERWKERDKQLWERIEAAIKEEEDKLRAAQEAERRKREEEDRKRREQEEKRRKEEEEKRRAEEEKLQKQRAEALQKEKEEAERREKEQKARQEKSTNEIFIVLREQTGMFDCEDMWKVGLRCLKYLRSVTMRAVKGPRPPSPEPPGYEAPPAPPLKKLWSAQRRKITPKIGQLTDDEGQIARITEELKVIVAPIANMPRAEDGQNLHHALLASCAKAIIAQAETEVTAHKAQAGPLARIAVSLIVAYPTLGDIFWARFCARVGCWAAGTEPLPVENESWDELPEKERQKRWGAFRDESSEERMTRIAGVMRLFFAMLFVSVKAQTATTKDPMPPPFRPGRFWLYLAQLLNNRLMLERPVAPEIIYVALDEGGVHAKAIWGKQFIKMLHFLYEGLSGEDKLRFGGSDVLAQASRARCLLEIEKIMALP